MTVATKPASVEEEGVGRRELIVTGMTCASCVASVEDALRGVAGVRTADVNLATERARVEVDPSCADDAALVRAVERAGYGALVLAADRAERAATEERERALRLTYLKGLRRRLTVAAALAIPTVLLSMADLLYPAVMQAAWRPYVLFALATPVQLWSALPFYRGALSAARHRRTDMNTLVVVGTTTAYAVSVLATYFGPAFTAVGLAPERFLYYDTATVIVTLVLAGRYLEARARARTADEVRALAALGAKTARVRRPGGVEEEVPIDRLAVGDVVIVRPGEVVAADGRILAGSSAVNEAMVTGESIPVEKGAGDEVTGGTQNGTGTFRFRVTRVGGDTLVAQIVRLVEEAQGSKPPIQRLVDRIASIFVPIVFAIAFAGALARLVFGPEPGPGYALAAAVVELAAAKGLALSEPTTFEALPGQGVHATVDGHEVWIGGAALARAHGFAELGEEILAHHQENGRSVLLGTIDSEPGGILALADTPKAAARDAIADLRRMGLRTLLVSGDARRVAEAIAHELGIDEVRAEIRPDGKAEIVAELQVAGHHVAMVGDGVNDAPALARADLGIAIGSGTDVAVATADVVLVGGDPRGVPRALRLARATVTTIRQNLFWAFIYNVALIPVAAGVLYPFTGWLLSPVLAAAAMALSSVTVVSNSLRLRSVPLR